MAKRENFTVSFIDGSPNGPIECINDNWKGIAYRFPRKEKDKYKDHLNQTGVYLLFDKCDDESSSTVYVGKAETQSIFDRLQQHDKDGDKDSLTEVIVFTKNDSMGPSQVCFLENRFYEMAKKAKRYNLLNSKTPSTGNYTKQDESDFNNFIDYAKLVMGILGCKVFERINRIEFYIKLSNNKKAIGRPNGIKKEFVVSEGSYINKIDRLSFDKAFRKKYASAIDADGKLLKDIIFNSISQAAEFVVGYGTSGNVTWKPVIED